MATLFGHRIGCWLVERGWGWALEKEQEEPVFGDRLLIDPQTRDELNPYKALERHYQRTGETPEFWNHHKSI